MNETSYERSNRLSSAAQASNSYSTGTETMPGKSEVEREFFELKTTLAEAHDLMAQLEGHLAPYTQSPVPEKTTASGATPHEAMQSSFGASLQDTRFHAKALRDRIAQLMNRLCL